MPPLLSSKDCTVMTHRKNVWTTALLLAWIVKVQRVVLMRLEHGVVKIAAAVVFT
jgi:hypothetical protein